MKAVICRTGSGSGPVPTWNLPASPRVSSVSLSVHDPGGIEKNSSCSSPNICLQMDIGGRRSSIRRASSMPSVIRSEIELSGRGKSLSKLGSRSFPDKIPEGDEEESSGSLTLFESSRSYAGDWPSCPIPVEELCFPGGGIGKSRNSGGGGGGDEFSTGDSDKSSIASYYERMLTSDPTNALLLRNYAKYLHEVEKDFVKAEEYYGRAILASPGDGEVLSLYGKFIWETQKDGTRAKSYFDQAVNASPDDCTVLGSYANFMWEVGDDEEEEEDNVLMVPGEVQSLQTMVESF